MEERAVVTCFLRDHGEILLLRRSDAVGSYAGRWGGVAGHVETKDGTDRTPEAAAYAEIREETGLDEAAVTPVRGGEPFTVADEDLGVRWRVTPFLFDSESRAVETDWETDAHEWAPPTAIRRRPTVPALWRSYDRVRPRIETVAADGEHGAAWLSVRALEVLRDEASLAAAGPDAAEGAREAGGDDWDALAALAESLLAARPAMAVVANRVNRAMATASEAATVAAVERAARDGIERAVDADAAAAATAADRLPDRVATLSRSGTVLRALAERDPAAVLVAESRPGREGIGVAERLAADADVTLTTDAAFPEALATWDAGALLVGADRLLPDGRVVNKVGTRGAALAADAAGIPCYVVAASDKIAPAGEEGVDREERDPAEVYDGDAALSVANPTFDVTPAGAVSAVLTEDGALTTDDLRMVAERHRRLGEWER